MLIEKNRGYKLLDVTVKYSHVNNKTQIQVKSRRLFRFYKKKFFFEIKTNWKVSKLNILKTLMFTLRKKIF